MAKATSAVQAKITPVTDDARLMTMAAAAAYCGMSVTTYRRHIKDGSLPAPLVPLNRIDRLALDNAISGSAPENRTSSNTSAKAEITAWRNAQQRKVPTNDN